ncbi:MAG TPA: YdeI/OmpD-associated family protein [Flavobacteriales bacterium]|nr:YdeI/OmpD-associated family protein [Flavobacteriales bacterium]
MNVQASIAILGVNPYVLLTESQLQMLFKQAGRDKGPIPIKVTINKQDFVQNLVKYKSKWRLYLNMPMRKAAGKGVGDTIKLSVKFDPQERVTEMHPKLKAALDKHKKAKAKFESLPASRQKEIKRYIGFLKSDEAIEKNINRAINFLLEKERFIGRDKP